MNLTNTLGSGTYAAWSAQTSAALGGAVLVTTASVTSLLIGQGTKTATVATGLSITPGQYVKFISQADTTIWMQGVVSSYNSVTGVIAFIVASASIALEIRRAKDVRANSSYIPYYDWDSVADEGPVLSASVGDGITILDLGVFQISFTVTDIRTLDSGATYIVGCIYTSADGEDVRQLFIARLPVLSGYVS